MAEIPYNGVPPCTSAMLSDVTLVIGGSTDTMEIDNHHINWGIHPSAVVKPEPKHWIFSSATYWLYL